MKRYKGILLGFSPLKGHVSEYDNRKRTDESIPLADNGKPFSQSIKKFLSIKK